MNEVVVKRARFIPILLASLLSSPSLYLPASAANAQAPQINVFGFEDSSCGAWIKSANNRAIRMQYEFWIRGFVSGQNYGDPGRQVATGGLPAGEALYQYLDQYCRDNPKATFIGGAIALVEQLRQPTPAAPAKKSPTQPSGASGKKSQ